MFLAPSPSLQTPKDVVEIIKQVLDFVTDRPRKSPGQSTGPSGELLLQTVEAREAEARWIKIGVDPVTKFPRHPEPPFDSLYPHPWVKKMESASDHLSVFELWKNTFRDVLAPTKVPQLLQPRYQNSIRQMECWFYCMPKHQYDLSKAPHLLIKGFLLIIESLLELLLLATPELSQGTMTTSTTELHARFTAMWHASNGVDYVLAVQEARKAKPPQSLGSPFSQRGRK
jgi:hypothetical protein